MRRQQRVFAILIACLLICSLLTVRLIHLQLFQQERWVREAVRQRSQHVVLDFNRGDIVDRNGFSLLGGEQEKVLAVFPDMLQKSGPDNLAMVGSLIAGSDISDKPFIVLRNLDDGLDDKEREFIGALSAGGLIVAESRRRYGPEALATHLVGHIGPNDGEGKVGLELVYDEELRGSGPLSLAAVVDGRKRLVEGVGYRLWAGDPSCRPADCGPRDLVLTIDGAVQRKVEEIMDRMIVRGAVVVMDPHSGDILAMASRPNYKQDSLSIYMESEELLSSSPFINRSILSYSPGSVFKIVVAAAALGEGKAGLSSSFNCQGHIMVGETVFRCYRNQKHGPISLAEAFAYSCNAVFIELALDLGKEVVCRYARAMGLGEKTGVPLGGAGQGGEAAGIIPFPGDMPFLGDLALMAIGQGKVEATPLQVARMTSVIANGGFLVEPRLVQAVRQVGTQEAEYFEPGNKVRVLDPLTARKLRFMMLGVTEYGTGSSAHSSDLFLGGKTGTAETGRHVDGRAEVYSWFTGLVPVDSSRAVVTIFCEESTRSPAEIFRHVAEAIYEDL